VQTIIFDFGNVIGYFDHRRATRRLAAHTSIPENDIFTRVYRPDIEDAYEAGRMSSAEFLRHCRTALDLTCPDDVLSGSYSDIFWPNDDVCALVPQLAGRYRLLLGSNTSELHSIQFKRQFADTLRHFHALVLSHEVGARKPAAAFFAHCQRLAGCAAEECVFIDDLPANIAGAKACGLHGIVYRDIVDLRHQLAALGIDTKRLK
jgi:putative hydrolase of the HAD superfamily